MISVAIVEDKRDIREGLKLILENADGFTCSNVYSDGESALESITQSNTDVVLMDIELPNMSGIQCVHELKSKNPKLDVIMLTVKTDDESIFQSLRAGAYGYLTKNIFPTRLLDAIKEIKSGGSPMSAGVARRVVSSFSSFKNPKHNLTNREKEVLKLLCEGKTYKVIAKQLFVSANTIRFHLKNIYKKLQVNSKYEAVIKANKEYYF